MKILAIDTSSAACSVALLSSSEVRMRHDIIPLQHAQAILPFIEEILGPDLHSLDALAWGCGPGSFTGLRIAASVIQALGFARELPVISVSSLAALAQTAFDTHGFRQMLVAVDARMGEVYWGAYSINSKGYAELCAPEGRCAPEAVPAQNIPEGPWFGVGDAWSLYTTELSRGKTAPQQIDPTCLPKALAVAQLGRVKYDKGEWLQACDALPVYLRDTVTN